MNELTRKQDTRGCAPNRLAETLKKATLKALDYLPTAIIIGLIALYYIQLSNMG